MAFEHNKATEKLRKAIRDEHIHFIDYADLAKRIGKTAAYASSIANFMSDKVGAKRNASKHLIRSLQENYGIDFDYDTPQDIGNKINRYWSNQKGGNLEKLHIKIDKLTTLVEQLNKKIDDMQQ